MNKKIGGEGPWQPVEAGIGRTILTVEFRGPEKIWQAIKGWREKKNCTIHTWGKLTDNPTNRVKGDNVCRRGV